MVSARNTVCSRLKELISALWVHTRYDCGVFCINYTKIDASVFPYTPQILTEVLNAPGARNVANTKNFHSLSLFYAVLTANVNNSCLFIF